MMQAIELVENDDFLFQFNVSIDTSDLMDYIRNTTRRWHLNEYDWVLGTFYNNMDFKKKFSIWLVEIITYRGFCYSFNIVDAAELFKIEK